MALRAWGIRSPDRLKEKDLILSLLDMMLHREDGHSHISKEMH